MAEPEFRIVKVPMLDTGIGREAGYANDRELAEAAASERAALPPHMRAALDEINRRIDRAFLFGPETRPSE